MGPEDHAQSAREALDSLIARGEKLRGMMERTDDEVGEEAASEGISAVQDLATALVHTGLAIADRIEELTNATTRTR